MKSSARNERVTTTPQFLAASWSGRWTDVIVGVWRYLEAGLSRLGGRCGEG
jgi:hypothetical protein